MGKGLQRVAAICGGLTVTAKGETVHYDANGKARSATANGGSLERVVRATWEYSRYRATLKRNGRTFAIVTPDGKNALNPFDEFVLLKALNGGSNTKL
jgi:hypothetical protein